MLGLSICYDLRFPEMYRIMALAGATVIAVPSAFTAATGPAHWELLLRARAVENQVFVIGAGQVGELPPGMPPCHGHSMIVDPWGTVIAERTEPEPGRGTGRSRLEAAANRSAPSCRSWHIAGRRRTVGPVTKEGRDRARFLTSHLGPGSRTDRSGAPVLDPPFEVGMFDSDGLRLYYEIHGHGPRVLVFMHGILMDSNMNRRLAIDLAARGFRVVLLDLPGHGLSDKPKRASFHRMDTYARHVVTSSTTWASTGRSSAGCPSGATSACWWRPRPPSGCRAWSSRCRSSSGPLPAAAITFIPMLLAVHFARPVVSQVGVALPPAAPHRASEPLDSVMNTLSNDPVETAAVLHGILAGPIAPTVDQRAAMDVPALVIGHQVDRLHPFHDAEQLARRLPRWAAAPGQLGPGAAGQPRAG